MTHLIDVLQKIGSNAALRDRATMTGELLASGLDPTVITALVNGSRSEVEAALGASRNVCCMIAVPDERPTDDRSSAA